MLVTSLTIVCWTSELCQWLIFRVLLVLWWKIDVGIWLFCKRLCSFSLLLLLSPFLSWRVDDILWVIFFLLVLHIKVFLNTLWIVFTHIFRQVILVNFNICLNKIHSISHSAPAFREQVLIYGILFLRNFSVELEYRVLGFGKLVRGSALWVVIIGGDIQFIERLLLISWI